MENETIEQSQVELQPIELRPVESNQTIEARYRDELLTFFSSGIFLFDTKLSDTTLDETKISDNRTNTNPIKLQNALIEYYSNDKLKKLTKRLFDKVSNYHKSEFDPQVDNLHIDSVDNKVADIEISQPYQTYTEQLQFMNYTVIKNLRDDSIYFIMLSLLMQELFNTPKQVENQIINNAVNKINERIEIISSDQVIKITQGLTIAKCKALGLNQYKWQTMEDDRVRPTHAANNQKIFDWDNPPAKTGHPGTEINCRCKPVVIVDNTRVGNMGNLLDLI
ncbi:MAG: phage minor head protein [Neisseriaceae bacterium]